MTQLWHSPLLWSAQPVDHTSPLQGYGIRWKTLTRAEQVVCANIVLIPVWWLAGLYMFMPALILAGIIVRNRFHLKRPNIAVSALLAFSAYTVLGSTIFDFLTTDTINPSGVFKSALFWFPLTFLFWYIQSNNIKVRTEVIAWACSVSVFQMVGLWLVFHFILGEPSYTNPRSLYSSLIGNAGDRYDATEGLSNYLILYFPHDKTIGGLNRWNFFFAYPEIFALVAGFMALIALELKQRLWQSCLLVCCILLVLLSGTRSVWIALPLVVSLRYLFATSKSRGLIVIYALMAIVSFTFLSLPSGTNMISNRFAATTEATSGFRANSTEDRRAVYEKTLERIPDNLLLGHWHAGPPAVPGGFALARIGTHSFILGTLLYRHGLVGTGLFLTFWVGLFTWLYKTRQGRPVSCFSILLLYTMVSGVMEFGLVLAWMPILLCTVIRSSDLPRRSLHA